MHALPVTAVADCIQNSLARGRQPVVLDVREPWEITTAHMIPEGAALVTIPMQQIPARLAEIDPNRPILALCHHGVRSQQVALFLDRQGYPEVYNITGGIDAWSRLIDPSVPLY